MDEKTEGWDARVFTRMDRLEERVTTLEARARPDPVEVQELRRLLAEIHTLAWDDEASGAIRKRLGSVPLTERLEWGLAAGTESLREELRNERAGERARMEAEIRAGGLVAERVGQLWQAEVKKLHERYAQETRSLLGAVPAALRREVGLKDTEEGLTASLAATVRHLVDAVHVRDENRTSILLSWRHALGATDGGEMGIEHLKTITAGLRVELEAARGELGRLGTEAREANRRARLHESNAAQFERTWHALRERAEKAECERDKARSAALAEAAREMYRRANLEMKPISTALRDAGAAIEEMAKKTTGGADVNSALAAANASSEEHQPSPRGPNGEVLFAGEVASKPRMASLGRVDCVDASSAKWSVQLLEPFPTDLRACLSRGRVKVNASNLGEPRAGEWEIREWSSQWTEPGMLVLEPAGGSEAIQAGDWLWLEMTTAPPAASPSPGQFIGHVGKAEDVRHGVQVTLRAPLPEDPDLRVKLSGGRVFGLAPNGSRLGPWRVTAWEGSAGRPGVVTLGGEPVVRAGDSLWLEG